MDRDPRQDAWLAGFAAGEGCFGLWRSSRAKLRVDQVVPRFQIALRADDAAILETLREAFGGCLSYERQTPSNPAVRWGVETKKGLAILVEYFDRFPLHAKKAADYTLWREAVRIYQVSSSGDPRLLALRDALTAGRAYNADLPDVVDPFEVQMALEIE